MIITFSIRCVFFSHTFSLSPHLISAPIVATNCPPPTRLHTAEYSCRSENKATLRGLAHANSLRRAPGSGRPGSASTSSFMTKSRSVANLSGGRKSSTKKKCLSVPSPDRQLVLYLIILLLSIYVLVCNQFQLCPVFQTFLMCTLGRLASSGNLFIEFIHQVELQFRLRNPPNQPPTAFFLTHNLGQFRLEHS